MKQVSSMEERESGTGHIYHHHYHYHYDQNQLSTNKQYVKLFTKANPGLLLTIRHGQAILSRADPSNDSQIWVKDEKYSSEYKDDEGFPCFSLINKETGQALKHSVLPTHPVQLIEPYNVRNVIDESILWTQGRDLGCGFGAIRMINNTRLNLDAFCGDKPVSDGNIIGLWEWNEGGNQIWKISNDVSGFFDSF